MLPYVYFHLLLTICSIVRHKPRLVKSQRAIMRHMDIGYILTVLGVIFVSMTLHELMHGLIASWLGDDTARLMGRLTLNPLKHVDPFMTIMLPLFIAITNMLTGAQAPIFGGAKPVPFNPSRIKYDEWGVALMAIAGPLVNLVLAFLSFALYVLIGGDASALGMVASISVAVNLGFFAFNILPIPPLDGSRVMYALAPDFVRRGMDVVERYGVMLVLVIVLVSGSILDAYMRGVIGAIVQVFARIFGVE